MTGRFSRKTIQKIYLHGYSINDITKSFDLVAIDKSSFNYIPPPNIFG